MVIVRMRAEEMVNVEFLRLNEHWDPAVEIKAQSFSDLLTRVGQIGVDREHGSFRCFDQISHLPEPPQSNRAFIHPVLANRFHTFT